MLWHSEILNRNYCIKVSMATFEFSKASQKDVIINNINIQGSVDEVFGEMLNETPDILFYDQSLK